MKGQDLFKALSEKSGIAADDNDLTAFLTANANLEIPDLLANSFISNLMNEKEAKLHQGLNSHFKQNTLAGVDKKIADLLAELQVDDTVKNEILGEKNTYEKVGLTVKKIQALEKAKVGASKGDKDTLQKEIERLNSEFTTLNDKHKAEIKAIQEQSEKQNLDFAIEAYLSSMNYANKEIPKEANVATARFLLDKAIQEKKLNVIRENKNVKLFREDGLPYTENHKEIPFNAFTDSILSTNKLLDVGNRQNTQQSANTQKKEPVHVDTTLTDRFYAEQLNKFNGAAV